MPSTIYDVVEYKRFSVSGELLNSVTSEIDLISKLLVNYQTGTTIFSVKFPLNFLLKFLHQLRFNCDEIILDNDSGILYSIFKDYPSPVIEENSISQDFLNIDINIADKYIKDELVIDLSKPLNFNKQKDFISKFFKKKLKFKSIVLIGNENPFLSLLIGFNSYYFADNLYFKKDSNSKKERIF